MKKLKKKNKSSFVVSRLIVVTIGFFAGIFILFLFANRFDNSCANAVSCIQDLTGQYDVNAESAVFMGKKVSVPSEIARNEYQSPVLGESTGPDKHIYIDLTNQRLMAMEDGQIVHTFLVSTGKWGRTPTGDFKIWIKLKYTRMTGGNRALGTFYDLPNVPYTMFFYNNEIPKSRGYGIHGAYWHNNFGHPMSHGCINMKNEDAEILYNWATPASNGFTTYASEDNPGTPITIYGTAPNE